MSISVIVATYGSDEWKDLAWQRAVPSLNGTDHCWFFVNHEQDGTVASSRNAGAKKAHADTDWLCFLDADDELAPGYIGAMQRAIERAEEWRCSGCNGMRSALCGDCEAAHRDRRFLLTPAVQIVRRGRGVSSPTFFKQCDLRDANWIVIGTLIHRDLFWEVGGFDNHPHGFEDWALWSKCARAGASVVKVPDAVYRYWANPQSKHREGWRNKQWQRDNHDRVRAELDEWEAARA